MSISFHLLNEVASSDLFDGRLERFGVREHLKPDETSEMWRCLTDGRNYVWVQVDDQGLVCFLTRYAGNVAKKILNAIAEAFDTDIVSEYEPQYWGFDTQEEWNAWLDRKSREADERFYTELCKYLRGEANDIRPGTCGMEIAEIAKKLVEKDPTLLMPINKDKLRKEIESTSGRDQESGGPLDARQRGLVKMLATHEDDLPRA